MTKTVEYSGANHRVSPDTIELLTRERNKGRFLKRRKTVDTKVKVIPIFSNGQLCHVGLGDKYHIRKAGSTYCGRKPLCGIPQSIIGVRESSASMCQQCVDKYNC